MIDGGFTKEYEAVSYMVSALNCSDFELSDLANLHGVQIAKEGE